MKHRIKGLLMLSPDALPLEPVAQLAPTSGSPVAVLPIRGPLDHHANGWCQSYDELLVCASRMLSEPGTATLLLDVDSPGGAASGCFEFARTLRDLADAHGKRLVAFAHNACSAAYAIACVAHKVYAAPSANVGSIGVLNEVISEAEALKRAGLDVRVVTSGDRKADGHSALPVTDDAIAALQTRVNASAELFYAHVAAYRPDAGDVKALGAGILGGELARSAGLVDEIATFGQCLAALATNSAPAGAGSEKQLDKEELLAALKAKLEAGEITDDDMSSLGLAPKAEDNTDDEGTEDNTDGESAEDDEPEAKAVAVLRTQVAAQGAQLKAMAAEREAQQLNAERQSLFEQRPDFTAEMKAVFETGPIEALRQAVKTFPRVSTSLSDAQAALVAKATGTAPSAPIDPALKASLSERMGIGRFERGTVTENGVQRFGVRRIVEGTDNV